MLTLWNDKSTHWRVGLPSGCHAETGGLNVELRITKTELRFVTCNLRLGKTRQANRRKNTPEIDRRG